MKQKHFIEQENKQKNMRSSKMDQYLNDLLNEKKKLKKKNIELRQLRDQIQNQIRLATDKCKDLMLQKKNLLTALETSRLQKKLPVSKLVQKQRTIKLQTQIIALQKLVQQMTLRLQNRKEQYNLNLKKYDQVLIKIGQLSKQLAQTQAQVLTEVNNLKAIKNVNFDYEKLRRLLQDQKDFALKTQLSQNKSHEQKLKEFQNIKKKLVNQQELLLKKGGQSRKRASVLILNNFFKQKLNIFYRKFFTFQVYLLIGHKSIKIMKNFIEIVKQKNVFNLRVFFNKWHSNALQPMKLININEKLSENNLLLKLKIKTLSKWNQQFNKNQLQKLNEYQKAKILVSLRIQLSRKQIYIGFNKWRDNSKILKLKQQNLKRMMRIFRNHEKRYYFRYWKNYKQNMNRILQGNIILNQFDRIKMLSKGMRRWRLNIIQYENSKVQQHLKRNNLRDLITLKLRYQKRKSKLITILQLKNVRNQLRSAFYKFWGNVFSQKVQKKRKTIQTQVKLKQVLRNQCKQKQSKFQQFKKTIMAKIMYRFFYKKKKLAFIDWVNKNAFLRKRSYSIYHLLKKKDTVQKLYSLNRFRKNQKDFQKKQMHAVLTDLNHKMESINAKSTQYREKLQQSIQRLSQIGQKKFQIAIDRIIVSHKKFIFEKFRREKLSRIYKTIILNNLVKICSKQLSKDVFFRINLKSKKKKRSNQLKKLELVFKNQKNRKIKRRLFFQWKTKTKKMKKGLAILEHFETLFFFYKFLIAFQRIGKKVRYLKIKNLMIQYKNIQKNLETRQAILEKNKKENLNLQTDIKNLFLRFLEFQNLNRKNKQNQRLSKKCIKKYYYWRKIVRDKKIKINTLSIFDRIIYKKNLKIFFRHLFILNFKRATIQIKQQMSKLSKKKKTFDQKTAKTKQDIMNKLKIQQEVHEKIQNKLERKQKKYQNYLNYIQRRNKNRQKNQIITSIFNCWKGQYLGAKNMFKFLQFHSARKQISTAFHEIGSYIILLAKIAKRNFIIQKRMDLKLVTLKKQGLKLWKQKKRAIILGKINNEAMLKEQQIEENRHNYLSYAPLYAKAKFFYKKKIIFQKIFQRFKKKYQKKLKRKNKIKYMKNKINLRIQKQIFQTINWRRYFKITSRQYIKNQNLKYDKELTKDIFEALKVRRHNLKWAFRKFDSCNIKFKSKILLFAFLRVRNVGLFQRDLLNHNRKRALHHILKKLMADHQLAQQRTLYRWHFHQVERKHYLPYILNSLTKNRVFKIFYKIREFCYWHKDLISIIADRYLLQNKNDTKSGVGLLLEQNIDPQQIKQWMKARTSKDVGIIRRTIHKLRHFGDKGPMVRAWKSWLDYVTLKKKIKKSLRNVLSISQGKGKYWNRWKGKDLAFIATLKKQSRGNMMLKYKDLNKLLKQYRRDIKSNSARLYELKTINDQYEISVRNGKFVGLRVMSTFLQKSLHIALELWKTKSRMFKKTQQNYKFENLGKNIQELMNKKEQMLRRVMQLQNQNNSLRQNCLQGGEYANLLKQLLHEKQKLSISLADKKHNVKILLEDNLRIKQKLRSAQQQAMKLISQFEPILNNQDDA